MSENVYNAGLPARRHMGGGTIASVVSEASGLARTRHYGSTSSVKNIISQTASLVRPRSLYNDHSAIWTSGVYVRLDLPATPIIVQDRADSSKYVFRVTNAGAGYFSGAVTAGSFVGGSIDIPSVGGAGFHVDTSGNLGIGGTSATSTKVLIFGSGGSAGSIWIYGTAGDATTKLFLDGASTALWFGAGGSTPADMSIARVNSSVMGLGHGSSSSAALEIYARTAPGGSTTSNAARVYSDVGTLKWQSDFSSGANIYDLSKTLDILTTLGDTTYASAANTPARLAGNTTTAQKFYTQTGTGSVSAAPAWFDLFGTANAFTTTQTFAPGTDTQAVTITENATQTQRVFLIQDSSAVEYFKIGGTSAGADVRLSRYAAIPTLTGRRAEGTSTSPTAVAADSIMLQLDARGFGTSFVASGKAQLNFVAAELWSGTAAGAYIQFKTTPKTTLTAAEVMRLTDQGATWLKEIAAPTTPDSGFGAVYVDSTHRARLKDSTGADTNLGPLAAADLPTHGATQHTDITRTVYRGGSEFTADGGTLSNVGTAPDTIRRLSLAAGAANGGFTNVQIPSDAVAAQAASLTIYWIDSASETTHGVAWSIDAKALNTGVDVTSAGTTTTPTVQNFSPTANQLVTENAGTILASVSAGDIIRIDVRRGAAGETITGTVSIIGVALSYSANG